MSINLTHTNDSILPDSGNLSVTGNLVVSSRLGVGTSAPTSPLTVNGNIAILSTNRLLFPDASGTTSLSGTQLNVGFNSFSITGGVSYANVISDRQIVITKAGHASDSGQKTALLIRPGSDPASLIYNPFEIQKFDNTILLSVDKQGKVGIGTGSPTSNLHVIGTANIAGPTIGGSNATPIVEVSGTWNTTGRPSAVVVNLTDTASAANSRLLDLQTAGTSKFRVLKSGQVNAGSFYIGFSTDAETNLSGFARNGNNLLVTTAGTENYNFATSGFISRQPISFASSDVYSPDLTLVREAADTLAQRRTTNAQTFRLYNTYTDASNYERANVSWSANTLVFATEGLGTGVSRNINISAANVGIGTSTPTYKLQVNGSFAATTKSFVIDHPTKDNHTLVYGSLEGPENGVYVRGRLQNKDTIELPDYWSALVDENSITVQLTPIGKHQNLYVKEIGNNTITVGVTGLFKKSIDCFYIINGERKDVPKLQVEVKL